MKRVTKEIKKANIDTIILRNAIFLEYFASRSDAYIE